MVKKLAALAGAGALLLSVAGPAFAYVLIVNEGVAFQGTMAVATTDTGGNSYTAVDNGGSITQSGDTTTGDAGAVALSQATANQYDTTVWSLCDCDVEVYNGGLAFQDTAAVAGADTGSNSYLAEGNDGSITQSGDTTTGSALAVSSAQSWANIFTTFVGAP